MAPCEPRSAGPKALTGMVDLTCNAKGAVKARLLDLVPGRTGPSKRPWATVAARVTRSMGSAGFCQREQIT